MVSDYTMESDNSSDESAMNTNLHQNRRGLLKVIGGMGLTGVSGLAGCVGGSGDGTNGADEPAGNGDGGSTQGTPSNGEWPDLSGDEVHFLTNESADPLQAFFDEVANRFEQATGASVKMEYVGLGTSATDRLAQLAQAGDPPEVYFAVAAEASQYQSQGVLAPVNSALENVEEMYDETLPERFRLIIDGDDYLMPTSTSFRNCWYRSDFGGDLPDFATWDEWLNWVKDVDDPQGIRGTYVPMGFGYTPDANLLSWAYSNGTKVAGRDDNGEVQIVMDQSGYRSKWIEVLEYDKQLHAYSPPATDATSETVVQAIPGEVSASARYGGARPKIQSILQEKPFAKAVSNTVQPKPPNGSHTSWGTYEGFVTFKEANNEAAQVYMEFFQLFENQVGFYTTGPGVVLHQPSPWKTVRESDEIQGVIEDLPDAWKPGDIKTLTEDVSQDFQTVPGETDPPNPYAGPIMSSNHINRAAYEYIINDKGPGQAIDESAQKLRDVLEQAKS